MTAASPDQRAIYDWSWSGNSQASRLELCREVLFFYWEMPIDWERASKALKRGSYLFLFVVFLARAQGTDLSGAIVVWDEMFLIPTALKQNSGRSWLLCTGCHNSARAVEYFLLPFCLSFLCFLFMSVLTGWSMWFGLSVFCPRTSLRSGTSTPKVGGYREPRQQKANR